MGAARCLLVIDPGAEWHIAIQDTLEVRLEIAQRAPTSASSLPGHHEQQRFAVPAHFLAQLGQRRVGVKVARFERHVPSLDPDSAAQERGQRDGGRERMRCASLRGCRLAVTSHRPARGLMYVLARTDRGLRATT